MGKELEKVLDELTDLAMNEIKKIAKKGDMTPVELKNATDAVCLLTKIEELQNGNYMDEEEYSESHPYSRHGSYARTRSSRTGRYMSNGYSGHSIKDRIVDNLEHMMDEAGGEYERGVISEWIRRVESN